MGFDFVTKRMFQLVQLSSVWVVASSSWFESPLAPPVLLLSLLLEEMTELSLSSSTAVLLIDEKEDMNAIDEKKLWRFWGGGMGSGWPSLAREGGRAAKHFPFLNTF